MKAKTVLVITLLFFSIGSITAQTTTASDSLKKDVQELIALLKNNVQPTKKVITRNLAFYPDRMIKEKANRQGQTAQVYSKGAENTDYNWAMLTLWSYPDGYEVLTVEMSGVNMSPNIWLEDEGANGLSDNESDGTFVYNSSQDFYQFYKYGYGNVNSSLERTQTSTAYAKAIQYFKNLIRKKKS